MESKWGCWFWSTTWATEWLRGGEEIGRERGKGKRRGDSKIVGTDWGVQTKKCLVW